jgi:hypothetical protein
MGPGSGPKCGMALEPVEVSAGENASPELASIRQNLWFAFGYNAIGVPLAAGILYPGFGLPLNLMIAAVMSLISVSVIANALRLRNARVAAAGARPGAPMRGSPGPGGSVIRLKMEMSQAKPAKMS